MKKIKIFLTVGSQQFQFNRLLEAADTVDTTKYEIFAQIGYSTYKPRNYEYIDFIDREEFSRKMNEADLVITHAGTGAIVSALKMKKKVLACARSKKYGEHVDDHQRELLKIFVEKNYINELIDVNNIANVIDITLKTNYSKFVSNTEMFIQNLCEIIEK